MKERAACTPCMNRSHWRMGRGPAASDVTNAGSESLARVASRLLSARWASINRAAQYSCVGWSSSRCSRPDLARHPLSTGRASSRGSSAPSGEIARDVIDVKKVFICKLSAMQLRALPVRSWTLAYACMLKWGGISRSQASRL